MPAAATTRRISGHRRRRIWRYLRRSVSWRSLGGAAPPNPLPSFGAPAPLDSSTGGVAFLLGLHSGSVSGAVGNGEHARLVVVHPCHGAATPAGKHASDLRRSEQPVAAEGAVAGDLALVHPGPDGPRTHAQGPGNFRSPQ